jgi:predicted dehydrogenase
VSGVPRIGFLGLGWIGRARMRAARDAGVIEVAALADPSDAALDAAAALAPGAARRGSLDALLDRPLDGIVIASPSALHADQSIRALDRGLAVFCQKPLGRTAAEVAAVLAAARRADRLLGLDLSYRFTAAMQAIHSLIREGGIGRVQAVELVFHNAYGPDRPWFYDPALSGGGCVMDLGIHLVDLALWCLGFPDVERVMSVLHASGRLLTDRATQCEDHAEALLVTGEGVAIRLSCSWRLHAGREAVIEAAFHGTEGGAALRNVNGSFYDFTAAHFTGTTARTLAEPPDDWGGRALIDWAEQLARDPRFNPAACNLAASASVLDRIYAAHDSRF